MAGKNKKEKDAKSLENIKEPTILIRPITRLGGLDNIHVALIALVIILIALLLAISYSKPNVVNVLNSSCTSANCSSTNTMAIHNASQIKQITEQMLASYEYVNGSLSLLPYYANVSAMTETYAPSTKSWFVTVPSVNPVTNKSYDLQAEISDTNTNDVTPFFQIPRPNGTTNNKVVAQGVVQVAGKSACLTTSPLQVYWFADPYTPGALASLTALLNTQNAYKNKINASLKVLSSGATETIARQVGNGNAQALGMYLICASNDKNYTHFLNAVNSTFTGSYVSANTLALIAQGSGINTTNLSNCLQNVGSVENGQALFADYYNITTTPSIITDCQYLSIPQTENRAICYANSSLC